MLFLTKNFIPLISIYVFLIIFVLLINHMVFQIKEIF